MAILIFCAKLILSTGLLYGYYHLFLRNKRFHHYNRFYLLSATLLSLVIPFINIPVNLFSGNGHPSTLIRTLKIINAGGWEEPVIVYARQNQWARWINVQNGLYFIYLAGAVTGLFVLVRSLLYISRLKKKYDCEIMERFSIYKTAEPGAPFSFFRSIFWDDKIPLNDEQGRQIFRHEVFHVKEKHSADVLLMEIVCCFFWFNPFFHLIKKEIKAIHEFLADQYAISGNNQYGYAELLLTHAISQKVSRLPNHFFQKQLKRRIIMITQSNLVRRSGYISRIMALPLLFILVSAFAVKLNHKPVSTYFNFSNKTVTVVIDPGHGGIFSGAINNGIQEKDVDLSISQKIKQLSVEYNVNVVLTRNSDALVGNATNLKQDLQNRVSIQSQNKADLFVSVHVNATTGQRTDKSGFTAFIAQKKGNDKDKILSSAILTSLKYIYAVDETIMQRSIGVQVLDNSICPAVLIECGYINNPKDAEFIADPANQEKIARKILEGIVKYSNAQTGGIVSPGNLAIEKDSGIISKDLSKLNTNDVKSIHVGVSKTGGTAYIKNGIEKSFRIKEISEHNTSHLLQPEQQHSLTAITFTNDTMPPVIFKKVEVEPDYPGGGDAWVAYLTSHLSYPKAALDKEIQGTVIIQFIVDERGKISDIKAISGPELLKAESIRIIKESGDWNSAVQNGKKVSAYKKQPISYRLERQ